MKNKRSLFFLSTSRNSREFVLDSPLATRWFFSVFVLFCFVTRLVGCFFFFGLLLAAIEVRASNSIKALPIQESAPCRYKKASSCHSKYLMNGWCCKYFVSAKEQEYRNRNVLYNINAYLPADWAFNPTTIWTEIQHKYNKVVLVLWHMKKINSRTYICMQIHIPIGLRSRGIFKIAFPFLWVACVAGAWSSGSKKERARARSFFRARSFLRPLLPSACYAGYSLGFG